MVFCTTTTCYNLLRKLKLSYLISLNKPFGFKRWLLQGVFFWLIWFWLVWVLGAMAPKYTLDMKMILLKIIITISLVHFILARAYQMRVHSCYLPSKMISKQIISLSLEHGKRNKGVTDLKNTSLEKKKIQPEMQPVNTIYDSARNESRKAVRTIEWWLRVALKL